MNTRGQNAPLPSTALAKKKGGLAVASAIIVTLLVVARLVHWPTEGQVSAAERLTLALDDRLGLVVERGSAVSWHRDMGGRMTLTLDEGRAFVRRSAGALQLFTPTLALRTSGGAVTVDVTRDETRVLVHEGQAVVERRLADGSPPPSPATVLEAGNTLRARANGLFERGDTHEARPSESDENRVPSLPTPLDVR
jgi:ferric-dicitrate binding protein FerR (iron transport regulator)